MRRYSESSPGSSGASSGALSSAVATMSGSSSDSQYVHSRSVIANSQQSLSRYSNGGVDSGSITLCRQGRDSSTGNGSGQSQQQLQQLVGSERLGDVNVYDGENGNEALLEDGGYVHFFNALG